ncbi:bifunctional diguanylate cyclase/phosphodiesterase [Chimaeribacter arupi]|uniref:Bifunctional diguanylate cyclase/phosphodiesterase n=2 Tax=Chimaeribacter arupi TaxID=2060066 RepID=A0A2N5EH66_9GAMM|nr:bifunctional diguanylate cyclase/phosphodiesterase [Chimaeribacter arupi]
MLSDMKLPEGFRSRFNRQMLYPLSAVLLILFVAIGVFLFWLSHQNDQRAQQQEADIITSSLTHSLSELAAQQRSVAAWEPVARKLAGTPTDITWLNDNVGAWLYNMFKHQQVFILSPDNRMVFASINGMGSDDPRLLPPEIVPLLTTLRAQSRQATLVNVTDQNLRRSRAPSLTDVAMVEGNPVVFAANQIHGALLPREPTFTLVSIRLLNDGFLSDLSQRGLIQGLHFTPQATTRPDETSIPVYAKHTHQVGYMTWQPDRPGSRMLSYVGPAAALFGVLMIGVIAVIVRSLWRSALNLNQSMIELRASEAQAQHLAFHDVLTGLPNRALLEDRLSHSLALTARNGGFTALLVLDLDRFKNVNDTLGHSAGDGLIKEVASRLSALVRKTDTVARIGGDEFVVVQTDVHDLSDVQALCQRIHTAIERPFMLAGNDTFIGVSIGVALAPADAMERSELMRKADIALYVAKYEGRGHFRYFEQSMDDSVQTRQEIATDLRNALLNNTGLQVHFQPQVDMSGQHVIGLEALLRWQHPTRGTISPDEFIPVAEENGVIIPLGEWVLRQACRASHTWPSLFIAVNVSPVQFRSSDFANRIKAIVAEEKADPAHIELEITESVLLNDDDEARQTLMALREAGFKIALDDFGTGYSSLSYLSRFPVDKIKIDRSFIRNLGVGENSGAIVESVVRLGRAMGLTVTAEGVETAGQMAALAEAGCDEMQGYLFSRAIPEDQLPALLAKSESTPH